MAKKRKAPRKSEPAGPREVDSKDARLTVRTYKDVANSEDEFYADKDEINFDSDDGGRSSKRRRKQEREEAFLEASDEEILGEAGSDSDEEEEAPKKGKAAKKSKAKVEAYSEDEEQEGEPEEGDEGWWGSSKKEYYDADKIETEADALEEEAEAKRLQAKKLAKMQEEDFVFDEDAWLAPKDSAGDEEEVVTEVLDDTVVTKDMTPDQKYSLLKTRYPEFDYLVDEFSELRTELVSLQQQAEGKPAKSLETVKAWILGCYVASLASYFAVLTSPARDQTGPAKALPPSELRDHEVMETLMKCREAWLKAKSFRASKAARMEAGMLSPPEEDEDVDIMDEDMPTETRPKEKKLSKAALKARKKKEEEKAKKALAVEQSLADLSTLLKGSRASSKVAKDAASSEDERMDDNRSDFGEEDVIDARTAEDKARRKKTLKFYTSQIVQKASKRAGASRDAGGDMDIPYRERLRDRAARLNLEAERRGKKDGNADTALGGDGDSGDEAVAQEVRGDEDEYYDMVAHAADKKKSDKAARFDAIAAARKGERVVEETKLGPDGKRQITYQIQKNKGLAPRRKKEVRNPRVKKRMMYEDKQKKLKTIKATYKGGEGRGGYQGELSGIKTGLVKSIKL
ncbi:Sas10 C-terminal domain-containing protein [Podospora conica]|nr:Sas10 C-terminal domain-containing protein [Schizothecium conicum]